MSVLFIDTDSEFPKYLADELNFDTKFLIKMPYTLDNKDYDADLLTDDDAKDFFEALRNNKQAITSGLNEDIYTNYFEEYFKAGEDILYVSFSSQMSSTFNMLDSAIEKLSEKYKDTGFKFRRFDTKNICFGTGISCYYAIKMHNEGKTNDEIYDFLTTFITKVKVFFTPKDLFYLKKGGRLSAASAVVGTMLQINPIIKVDETGKLVTYAKIVGRKKALFTIVQEMTKDIDSNYPITVVDADCAESRETLLQMINKAIPNTKIWHHQVGPVIGTHCGPDTIGVIYVTK